MRKTKAWGISVRSRYGNSVMAFMLAIALLLTAILPGAARQTDVFAAADGPASKKVAARGDMAVSTWRELVDAVTAANGGAGGDTILLTQNIKPGILQDLSYNLPAVQVSLTIDGGGHTLDFGTRTGKGFTLANTGSAKNFTLKNLAVAKSGSGTAESDKLSHVVSHANVVSNADGGEAHEADTRNWTVRLEDFSSEGTPTAGLVSVPNSDVVFAGQVNWTGNVTMSRPGTDKGQVYAKGVTFAAGSHVNLTFNGTSTGIKIQGNTHNKGIATHFRALAGASVNITHGPVANNNEGGGAAVYIGDGEGTAASGATEILVTGGAMVSIAGTGPGDWGNNDSRRPYSGVFLANAKNTAGVAAMQISGGSEFRVVNRGRGTAISLNVTNGLYKVSGEGSLAYFESLRSGAGTVTGTVYAEQTSDIRGDDKAIFRIVRKNPRVSPIPAGGDRDTEQASLFFKAGNNNFKFESGAVCEIVNEGNGREVGTALGQANNCGILFTNSSGNLVSISGYKTAMILRSEYGPVIFNNNAASFTLNLGPESIFEAYGRPGSNFTDHGVIDGSHYTFDINTPRYFDIQSRSAYMGTNGPPALSIWYGVNNERLKINNSAFSWWALASGKNIYGTPDVELPYGSYNFPLSGSEDSVGNLTDVNGQKKEIKPNRASRISANNSPPQITDIVDATNADRRIYAMARVPEGLNDHGRAPYNGEVHATLRETMPDGSWREFTASSKYEASVYGTTRQGVIEFDLGSFARGSATYRIVDAWRGKAGRNTFGNITADVITPEMMIPADVTPPVPAVVTAPVPFHANQRVLTGSWSDGPVHNEDPPVRVIATVDGKVIADGGGPVYGVINTDHTWRFQIPAAFSLQAGSLIQISLEDGAGNQNPAAETALREAVFKPGPRFVVEPVAWHLTLEDAAIGTAQAILLDPAKVETFLACNNVKGFDLSKTPGAQDTPVEIESISPQWDQSWLQWDARPPRQTKTWRVTYRIAAEPSITNSAAITVYNSERVEKGSEYIIGADHIGRINTTVAKSVTDDWLITRANAWAEHITDSTVIPHVEVAARSFPQDGKTEGSGDVTFSVKEEPGTKVRAGILVDNGASPVLSVPTPVSLPVGSSYHPTQGGVSAMDAEDKNITENIVINYGVGTLVNPNVPGVYVDHYQITDKDFNEEETVRVVVVNDGSFSVGSKFILQAKSFVVRKADAAGANGDDQIRQLSGALAWNGQTGQEVAPTILSSGGYYDETNDSYNIKIGVGADSGTPDQGKAVRNIKAVVTDRDVLQHGTDYIIAAGNFKLNPTEESAISDDELLHRSRVQVWEWNDGLTPVPQSGSEGAGVAAYTGLRNGDTGVYDLKLQVKTEPTTEVETHVLVTRGTAPVLTLTTPVEISVGGNFQIMDDVIATDTEDQQKGLPLVVTSAGMVNVDKAGLYTIKYSVTDGDHNTTEAWRDVIVNDGTITVTASHALQVQNFVILKDTMSGNHGEILGKSGARAWQFTATRGAISANHLLKVEQDGGYKKEAGDYPIQVVVEYQDGSGLIKEPSRDITGKVYDGLVLEEDDDYIIVATGAAITLSQAQSVSAQDLIQWTHAKAFRRLSLQETPVTAGPKPHTVQSGVGSYEATFSPTARPAVQATVPVRVVKGAYPVLTVDPNPHFIPVGSGLYDYGDGVSATDPEDGHKGLSPAVSWNGSVDVDVVGVYPVDYTATDGDGNEVHKIRVVVVSDGTIIQHNNYLLRARSFLIKANEVALSPADRAQQILQRSKAMAWEKNTGAPADPFILSDGGYRPDASSYDIKVVAREDYNVIRSIKAMVVNDTTVVDAGNYFIAGNPILMNTTLDQTAPDLVALGEVRAFRADDLLTPGTPRLDTYTGSFSGVTGNYRAAFFVEESRTDKLTDLPVQVSNRNKPILHVTPETVFLQKGEPFDPMDGVRAEDIEDDPENKPLNISHVGTVNINREGIYQITYQVSDSDFNPATPKVRTVFVGAAPIGPFALFADNFSLESAQVVTTPLTDRDQQIRSASNARIYDLQGQLEDPTQIVVRDAGGYRRLSAGEEAKLFTIQLGVAGQTGVRQVRGLVAHRIGFGKNYLIAANDFDLTVADTRSMTDQKLIDWAKARSFDARDLQPAGTVITDGHTIQDQKGSYEAGFKVSEEPDTRITANVSVYSRGRPAITASSPVETPLGAPIDLMDGVEAFDESGKEITGRVSILSGGMNTDVAGVYLVRYKVVDEDDEEAEAERVVVVNDGTYATGSHYIVRAKSFVVRKAQADRVDSELQIRSLAHVYAWDGKDGHTVDPIILADGGYYDGTLTRAAIKVGVAQDSGTIPENQRAIRNITARVVDQQVLVEGDQYFVGASEFRINTTDEKSVTDDDLLRRSGAQAWKKDDALTPVDAAVFGYTGLRNGTPNVYELTVHPAAEMGTQATVEVNVDDGDDPVLTVSSPLNLNVGDPFDIMTSVSAIDSENGDLTHRVTSAGIVDVNKKGVYTVRYRVADNDYNEVFADRIVAVGPMHEGDTYFVDGENFVILLDDVTGADGEILGRSAAGAWNKFTGAAAHDVLQVRDNGGYEKKDGLYPITIGATGDPGAEVEITGKVYDGDILEDDGVYIISASNVEITASVARDQYTPERLLQWAKVSAWKKSDLSEAPVRVGPNNVDQNQVGAYSAEYQVTARPSVSAIGAVDIIRGKKPVLTLDPNPYEIEKGSPFLTMSGVTVADEEDDVAGIAVKVTAEGGVDPSRVGVYKVLYTATDAEDNTDQVLRVVLVNDGTCILTPEYILRAVSFVIRDVDVKPTAGERDAQLLDQTDAKAWSARTGDPVSAQILADGGYGKGAGAYPVNVVVSPDRNVGKQVMALVVEDAVVVQTPGYFLAGNPIRMNTTKDKSRPDLIEMGKVRAYEKGVGLTVAAVALDQYTGSFDGSEGVFYATFGLPGRPADRLENLKVEITNGQPPILEVTTPVLLPTGTVWTTMAGVSVTDPEDDQAGRPLVIHASGRVDTNVEGLYKVTYSVTDADFNTASRTRLVAVGDFVVGGGFLLRAEGFSANVMDISGERSELILKTGAKAWTSEGVDAEVEVKTDGGYRKAGGDYQIVVGVKEQMAEPTRAVFAQISAKTHTVQFHGNGAASLPGPRSVQLTQPETRLQSFPSDPGRTGYAFLGWNTEKLSGGSWMKTGAVVTSDLTLYARWQINRYNLTFDVNGGKRRNPASQKVQYKGLAKAPAGPVHGDLNMKFSGWNTRKDGKGTGWNFSRSRMPARDVILYAIWKKTAPAKIKEKIVTKTKPIYVTRTWYNTIEKQVLTTVPAIWMVDADVSPPDLGEESRIPDPKTPTDASSAAGSTWSLINLLLMLIGCMMTILCLAILAFRQKRSARDDGEFSNKNLAGMALAAVATLANILIYMITQDRFATPMILTDGATFGTAAVFAVIITGLIASFWQFGDGEGKEA